MTHDELLAQIDDFIQYTFDLGGGKALRAVVELHKPKKTVLQNGINAGSFAIGCAVCVSRSRYETANAKYPCDTIKAIEKELA